MPLSKKIKQSKKGLKGFTLMETLIAVLLFSLLSVMVSGVFSSFLKNYTESKKTLQGVEGGQFAMNLRAKTIRVSDVKAEGTNILQVYDFSQAKCLKYSFAGKKLQVNYSTEAGQGSVGKCAFTSMGGAQDLTAADVQNASFSVVPSSATTLGFVIIALTIKDDTQPPASLPMYIQMAVSLRNYQAN